jgi:thiamine-phosphate pyrophosphorylase
MRASLPGRAFSLREPCHFAYCKSRPFCRQNGDLLSTRVEYPEAMAPQLYLITPAAADPESFPALLMSVLSAAEISALLVRRGDLADAAYAALAGKIVNIGQGAGCAVLLENDVALAKKLGADGVHVTTGSKDAKAAIAALKPAAIVGAGNITSRHDAMTMGELDVDYVFFGPLHGPTDAAAADLAQWWAETFEIPAVFSDPAATSGLHHGAEFLALSDSIWSAPSPAAAIAAIAASFEETA